jgi:hypothetical protein
LVLPHGGPIGSRALPYAPLVIVVIGNPVLRAAELGGGPTGPAALAALAAARTGAQVELVGKTGDDARGDALLLALAAGGVGHVALLRDAAHQTPLLSMSAPTDGTAPTLDSDDEVRSIEPSDPAARPGLDADDVQLALRYLSDYRVVLVAEPQPDDIVAVVADAAAYAGAALLVAVGPGWTGEAPDGALVVEADTADPDSRLAELLGAVAARVDHGTAADQALREVLAQQS